MKTTIFSDIGMSGIGMDLVVDVKSCILSTCKCKTSQSSCYRMAFSNFCNSYSKQDEQTNKKLIFLGIKISTKSSAHCLIEQITWLWRSVKSWKKLLTYTFTQTDTRHTERNDLYRIPGISFTYLCKCGPYRCIQNLHTDGRPGCQTWHTLAECTGTTVGHLSTAVTTHQQPGNMTACTPLQISAAVHWPADELCRVGLCWGRFSQALSCCH